MSMIFYDHTLCSICHYHKHEPQYISALGATPICSECYWNKAEHPNAIHQATVAAGKDKGKFRSLKGILKGATCWVGVDEGYLPLAEWERRKSERQLVLIKPVDNDDPDLAFEDEEEHLAHVMDNIRRATSHFYDIGAKLPEKKRGWLERFIKWMASRYEHA